jgi:transcriptional regulator with XRE-family HTH domain
MRKTLYQRENLAMLSLLRAERERLGHLQTDISRTLGKPQSYISKIERGERRVDVIELRKICQAMGCDLRQFVDLLEQRLGNSKS